MEVERYTLATGETAVTGFQRLWKGFGLVMVACAIRPQHLGALAYAGAGGTNNLVVSNWIRDKGYGMGNYAPRIASPISGEEEAAPSGQGYVFRPTPDNMTRWNDWWRKANLEQFVSFFLVGALTIVVFSLVAYSTVFGDNFEEANFDFINAAAMGIIDYVSRLVADVLVVG
jgi:hypothetical protein